MGYSYSRADPREWSLSRLDNARNQCKTDHHAKQDSQSAEHQSRRQVGKEPNAALHLTFNTDFSYLFRRSQEIADNASDEYEHISRGGSLSSMTTGSFSSSGQHHPMQQVEQIELIKTLGLSAHINIYS